MIYMTEPGSGLAKTARSSKVEAELRRGRQSNLIFATMS